MTGNPLDPAVLAATPEGRAEALLRRMEKDGWIDADWWAEAEPRRPEENLQGIVAAVIREAVQAERTACAEIAEKPCGGEGAYDPCCGPEHSAFIRARPKP